MGLLIKNIRDGFEYEGFNIDYIIDDDVKLGEVYLDEELVFQSDDVFTEVQLKQDFKRHFKITHIDDSIIGLEEDSIDYTIEGVSSGLYTQGGEYSTATGTEYVGDYHIHPSGIAMQGKFHDAEQSPRSHQLSILDPLEEEDILNAQLEGRTHNIDYTIDEDVYPHIGVDRSPVTLTDDDMLEEQRKEANKLRFGIEEDDHDMEDY